LEGPGKIRENAVLTFTYDRCEVAGETFQLDDLDEFRGTVRILTIPREAMGFGDVKFLGAIGAFLGWQAVLFTIFAASIAGCLVGVLAMIRHRNRGGTVIPFGPFLALGAILWIFGGNRFWEWYFRFF
jgi:leader peptidase (prepilin peptidase)/N-methyltransferase